MTEKDPNDPCGSCAHRDRTPFSVPCIACILGSEWQADVIRQTKENGKEGQQ